MIVKHYIVNVPMPDGTNWFQLCRCISPESAAEIVRVLLAAGDNGPAMVRVDVVNVEKPS